MVGFVGLKDVVRTQRNILKFGGLGGLGIIHDGLGIIHDVSFFSYKKKNKKRVK